MAVFETVANGEYDSLTPHRNLGLTVETMDD